MADHLDEPKPVDVNIINPVQVDASEHSISLKRQATAPTVDQPLWVAIRNRAQAIEFNRYQNFIDNILCEDRDDDVPPYYDPPPGSHRDRPRKTYGSPSVADRRYELERRPTIHGTDSYNLLKLATEAFLIFESGVVINNSRRYKNSDEKDDDKILEADQDGPLFNYLAERRRLGQSVTETDLEGSDEKSKADIKNLGDRLATYLELGQGKLPYLNRIVEQVVGTSSERQQERMPYCEAILKHRLSCPSLIELIWSYWHEEGMLAQTINAIMLRFQNKRFGQRDPLVNLELDPLHPLSNIIWGFVQDEYSRLSVQRRAYEYDHQYGFSLVGKAVPKIESADSRSKFIASFHNLLHRTAMFYREDDDATIYADAFALLNALREVHIVLAEGAHNQFGDLPWTARREMLMMQWILARPEITAFIRGRYSVPYQESWMGAVDDMKRLQGWGDVTITHFHELAIYGEQVLLSIRYGDWIDINDQELARNWARYWRPEIQRYMHAYQAVTGVDLTADVVNTRHAEGRYAQPSVHLSRRLAAPRTQGALLPPSAGIELPTASRSRVSRRRSRG